MLLPIRDVLTREQVAHCLNVLARAEWVSGLETAGFQSARAKNNAQVREDSPAARELGALILKALERQPLFIAAALPARVFPPLFNRYAGGQSFGIHVDNAIRPVPGTNARVRTDLSATLFLSSPEDYDGGELVIEDNFGAHQVKLPAGHLILYPASSLHQVKPVTRGERVASFFWIQSMVRDDAERRILFDLDMAIQRLNQGASKLPQPSEAVAVELTNVYHNLLRRWADT
jgi:PKHD-type hydroxylase